MDKQHKPILRFANFHEDWSCRTYGSVFSFRPTNSYSREYLNYSTGEVRNIHYGDIHTRFNTLFDINREIVPFINQDVSLLRIPEENYCRVGDLVVADASENYDDIGKCIEIINLNNERVLAGLHTFHARPNQDLVALGFTGFMLQSVSVRRQIKRIAQGTKVLGLSTKRLSEVIIHLPTLHEQQKIAAFLTAVDNKIQLLEKKKGLLEQYKKGVMQKIFNREIRFKDNSGNDYPDWESRKAKDLFRNHSNKNHDGELPILAVTQDKGAVLRDSIGIDIQSSERSIKSYKIVEAGDFIISLRSFQGGIEYSDVWGICSPAYTILKAKTDLSCQFFKYYFKKDSFIQQLSNSVVGIRDGKQISFDVFSSIKLPFPCKEEQIKIASFLSAIDDKISQISRQIELIRRYKKGLLQQMFV